MAEAKTALLNRPTWVDLSTSDAGGAREFYSKLFGWQVEVSPDPMYGGYGMAKKDGRDVAGIGPKMAAEAPTAWSVYIGTDDIDGLAGKVAAAGGTVAMAPFDVGAAGRMAVFQDPSGAFICAWQAGDMAGFEAKGPGTYGWGELNARGFDKALAFYGSVFGWGEKRYPMGDMPGEYHEFQLGGETIAGGMEMAPPVPAEMPSYWLVYFSVEDPDASYAKALELGGREMLPPQDFPGGRFAIVSDPQGAAFGLLKTLPRE